MEKNGLVKIAAIKELQREVLKNTQSLCMMESNTLANIATTSKSLKKTPKVCV